MISFLLNETTIETEEAPAGSLLSFLRENQALTGTKAGCREGDCGACCVLVGFLNEQGQVEYRSVTSCLFPLHNAQGAHVLTIEGLRPVAPNPIQTAVLDHDASQCGFCTPGFIMSWLAFCLGDSPLDAGAACAAVDGNICRCTGYASLKRAAGQIAEQAAETLTGRDLNALIAGGYLPQSMQDIPQRLHALARQQGEPPALPCATLLAGGTDLLVQRPLQLLNQATRRLWRPPGKRKITVQPDHLLLDGALCIRDLEVLATHLPWIPDWPDYLAQIASTPIRNMATLAGNFANASPIGDLSILFLALDAQLLLGMEEPERKLPLDRFFLAYRHTDLRPGERIWQVEVPLRPCGFHFIKVSKRRLLDIASVNSAMAICHRTGVSWLRIAAGGVAPVPLLLQKSAASLLDKQPCPELLAHCLEQAEGEIQPISDVRGSAAYKRLLLRQQLMAHFQHLLALEVRPT
jgi:xanthine dehydrogenase small subunit